MGMIIGANLFPIRLKITEKIPFEFELQVQNEDDRRKMITISVELPPQVTFAQNTVSTDWERRIEAFKPRSTIATKLPIYMSRNVSPGAHSGAIIVREHFHEFGVVEREYRKQILFRIYE